MTDQRDIGLRHFFGRDLQCIPPSNRREQVDAQLITLLIIAASIVLPDERLSLAHRRFECLAA